VENEETTNGTMINASDLMRLIEKNRNSVVNDSALFHGFWCLFDVFMV